MKKKVLSIILTVLVIFVAVMAPKFGSYAADYPKFSVKKAVYEGYTGQKNLVCEYLLVPTYRYEKITIIMSDLSGNQIDKYEKKLYYTSRELGKEVGLNYEVTVPSRFQPQTIVVKSSLQYSEDGTTYYDIPTGVITTTFNVYSASSKPSYSNEWANGVYYNADGSQTYSGTLSWGNNASGWFVQDTKGWSPRNEWVKIDGKYYYFTANGSMDYSEYRDGCWLGADGAWDPNYSHGTWKSDANGWWYEDNGWYPTSQWLWIDGVNYYFGANGYMQ